MRLFVLKKVLKSNSIELLGLEFETSRSGKCFIIDYQNCTNVTVMFYDPIFAVKCTMSNLRRGVVNNPFSPRVYGKGFVGIGKYSHKDVKLYKLWSGMLERAYSSKLHNKLPTYKDVTVCKEWLCLQNFAEWCESQKSFKTKDNRDKSYHLDKDILVKGNKVYSPDTCCFVPAEINTLFVSRRNDRGDYPLGVHLESSTGKFKAQLSYFGKRLCLGTFNTEHEAFNSYKLAKEGLIKDIANKWRGKIDTRVYEALVNYKVEMTD